MLPKAICPVVGRGRTQRRDSALQRAVPVRASMLHRIAPDCRVVDLLRTTHSDALSEPHTAHPQLPAPPFLPFIEPQRSFFTSAARDCVDGASVPSAPAADKAHSGEQSHARVIPPMHLPVIRIVAQVSLKTHFRPEPRPAYSSIHIAMYGRVAISNPTTPTSPTIPTIPTIPTSATPESTCLAVPKRPRRGLLKPCSSLATTSTRASSVTVCVPPSCVRPIGEQSISPCRAWRPRVVSRYLRDGSWTCAVVTCPPALVSWRRPDLLLRRPMWVCQGVRTGALGEYVAHFIFVAPVFSARHARLNGAATAMIWWRWSARVAAACGATLNLDITVVALVIGSRPSDMVYCAPRDVAGIAGGGTSRTMQWTQRAPVCERMLPCAYARGRICAEPRYRCHRFPILSSPTADLHITYPPSPFSFTITSRRSPRARPSGTRSSGPPQTDHRDLVHDPHCGRPSGKARHARPPLPDVKTEPRQSFEVLLDAMRGPLPSTVRRRLEDRAHSNPNTPSRLLAADEACTAGAAATRRKCRTHAVTDARPSLPDLKSESRQSFELLLDAMRGPLSCAVRIRLADRAYSKLCKRRGAHADGNYGAAGAAGAAGVAGETGADNAAGFVGTVAQDGGAV